MLFKRCANRKQILSEIYTGRDLGRELSTLPFDRRIACLAHVTATGSNALSYEIAIRSSRTYSLTYPSVLLSKRRLCTGDPGAELLVGRAGGSA